MSNRHVSFDIESRDNDGRPVMMVNGEVVGYITKMSVMMWHQLFDLLPRDSRWRDDPIFLYPSEMHLADQFTGREVHEIEPIDFAPIERRVMAYMDELIAQDFIPRPIDFDICDVVAQMKPALRAFPHEPHRTYDWRQRIATRKRRRK